MVARFRSWRQKTRKPIEVIGFIAVLVVAIALIFVEVRVYGTGFTGKTLWDWLQLLFIPVVLAVAGFWFNHNERKAAELRADNERKAVELRADNERKVAEKRDKTAREIAEDNQREVALQAYLDKISELLLEKHLRDSDEGDEVRKIARVRTLTVFPRLDPHRKRSVLQFLQESGLIDKDKRIVAVNEADLSNADLCAAQLRGADLREANLSHADLSFANLDGADLRGVNLDGTVLRKANLNHANLSGVDLSKAILWEIDLSEADLSHANLSEVDLRDVDLHEATLSHANLSEANLRGANLNEADLRDAYLQKTDLRDADLSKAQLRGADLCDADLSKAQLRGADLRANLSGTLPFGPTVTTEQLEKAASLKGATMPDGSIHP